MKLSEAYKLLDQAPCGDEPSALNPNLPQAVAVKIVRDAVATLEQPLKKPCGPEDQISPLAEKRVWQVFKNQKRPRY